ncbi:hypothetical protein BDZ97DRAFT_1764214 [Flammula alnicola]|nr:hypothetical protein BDZ97DRAFT_1764214 [Flammula alnicola]
MEEAGGGMLFVDRAYAVDNDDKERVGGALGTRMGPEAVICYLAIWCQMTLGGLWIISFLHNCSSVPMSNLPRLMNETKRDITDAGLVLTIVGHVGDGNFLVLILFKTDKEKAKVRELVQRMMKQATAWTGLAHEQALLQSKVWIDHAAPFSVTGKHGVGLS